MTAQERRLVTPCFFSLILIGAGIRLLGYRRTRGFLERFVRDPPQRAEAASLREREAAARITWVLNGILHRGPYKASCLPRSLTLWWLLQRRGIAGELHFGAQRSGDGIRAHAWVELDGVPLNDDQGVSDRYPPFGPAVVRSRKPPPRGARSGPDR